MMKEKNLPRILTWEDWEIMMVVSRTMMMSFSKKKKNIIHYDYIDWKGRKKRRKGKTNLIIDSYKFRSVRRVETACNPGESNDIDRMTLRPCQFAIVKEQCEWTTLEIIFLAQLENYLYTFKQNISNVIVSFQSINFINDLFCY